MLKSGFFKNGNMYDGTWYYENGDFYEGKFNEDGEKDDDDGFFQYASGKYYRGGFKDDKKHGKGELTSENYETIHEGYWKNDKYVGKKMK